MSQSTNGIICLLFLLTCSVSVFGQSKIRGKVVDQHENKTLENASVMLLQAKDSILVRFTRADKTGDFSIDKPDTGNFLLIVSYPKYGDFYEKIDSNSNLNLGEILMSSAAHLIEEVMVTGRIPVVIKGDTTEYDAGSFTVEKNAKVEDLLKVLPGITVDASGKITAQGKTVEKVLVDGEEFFGDDPTLVTRNIRSDMVDKVQVYEKKSEDTERTGVDDGERIQTINVQLRDDAKNGVFGKATAGGATDDYYTGQLMVNKFKGSQKIGAFLITGNNGTTGLSWDDSQKYGVGGGGDVQVSDDGGVMISGGGSDEFLGGGGQYGGNGIPRALNTGVNFNDKWKGDRNKINLSYMYGKIASEGESERLTQNNLEDRTLFSEQNAYFENDKNRHQFNMKYDLKIDSLTTLTIDGRASKRNDWNLSNDSSFMTNQDGNMLNEQYRNQTSKNNHTSVNVNGYLTKKFLKEGRSLSLRFNYSGSDMDGDQFLNNRLHYYAEDGTLESESITDQMKRRAENTSYSSGSVAYTEPISKLFNLSLSYGVASNLNTSTIYSYDKDGSDQYTQFDSLYSSDFDYRTLSSNYNIALNFKNDNFNINLTNVLRDDILKQENNFTNDLTRRSFLTYNPSLSVRYNISRSSSIGLRYRGTNNLPSLNQIRPLRNNEDELNIYLGNESLRPEFRNNISLDFGRWRALQGSYLYGGVNLSNLNNPLILNVLTDDRGRSTYRWENLNGKSNNNFGFYGGGGMKLIRSWDVGLNVFANININDNYNYINDKLNKAKYVSYSINPRLERSTTKGFNFTLALSPGYTKRTTDLQPEFDNSGFTLRSQNSLKYYFPKQFQLFTEVNYMYEAPTTTFNEKFERLIINPGVSKKVLKDESIELAFIVNDVLNQNVGFRRFQNGNVFTQNSYDTIRRYYMVRVSWDFNKMFTKNTD